ncbi:DNL zinc finger-domain-containing protein [Rhodofomes roseus]|uniref:DNL zinc finger-domain-containing protein n=1 Tax=Rhodofomes roseus TaxID=34475 RepID=A0ABQ8KPE6_9APHY|nr:DNL zinc finger-domain-containing protein [Rhodofomes roseus]KAH9840028.1 DNL zinc finger-domain-containing protein [Rhodofomes roseus]
MYGRLWESSNSSSAVAASTIGLTCGPSYTHELDLGENHRMNALRHLVQRSLIPPSPSTFRLGFRVPSHWQYAGPQAASFRSQRLLSSTPSRADDEASSSSPKPPESQKEVTFKTEEPRLSLTFTCTVPACDTRSSHMFTKRSYERGIVIVQCSGCKNRHLIADHLGWFKESTEEGKLKTVEDLVRAKGEKVRRGVMNDDGVVEYSPE